jgi:hypothetical protein
MFRQIDNAVAFSAVKLMLRLIVTAVTSLNRGATSAALNTSASTAIASPPLSMIARATRSAPFRSEESSRLRVHPQRPTPLQSHRLCLWARPSLLQPCQTVCS